MSVIYEERRGDTWEDRITQVISMTEQALNVRIPNPQDVTGNVVCNGCGRVAGGTIDQPPTGWRLGRFGENDYCPECA